MCAQNNSKQDSKFQKPLFRLANEFESEVVGPLEGSWIYDSKVRLKDSCVISAVGRVRVKLDDIRDAARTPVKHFYAAVVDHASVVFLEFCRSLVYVVSFI